jgi:YaiO family outer membrane protein
MTSWLRAALLGIVIAHASAAAVDAQEDGQLSDARAAVAAGRRAEAMAMLESRLAAVPRDVDARLLHAQILSWEARYDDARRELQDVLLQSPSYTDARVALMNVEWWSGRTHEASDVADAILAVDPGHTQARAIRERSDAARRPWLATISHSIDSFSDGRGAWRETTTSLTRRMPRAAVIARVTDARRSSASDRQVEIEIYPRFRPGTSASVGVGVGADRTFFPAYRASFDLYQTVSRGFELSVGIRRLGFDDPRDVFAAGIAKYSGSWLITLKALHVPGAADATAYQTGVRRYVGSDGTSYVGVAYSHGLSHEEIRHEGDLARLDSDAIRTEVNRMFGSRVGVLFTGGSSRQERLLGDDLWQTFVSAGLMVRF